MKRALFSILTLLLPLLLLGALEGGLRLFGVGTSYDLFVRKGAEWETNRQAAGRYFSRRDIAIPEVQTARLPVEKTPLVLRVACLGESSTAGFPFEVNISFPAFLRVQLEQRFPGRSIQVVNLGVSAISSAVVADFAAQLEPISPDVVLIYTGHNEFYGALGAASSEGSQAREGAQRLALTLRGYRLYQLLQGLLQPPPPASTRRVALMEALVSHAEIPLDGALFQKTLEQFTANLDRMLDTLAEQHIPVVLSTLASNLKDQPPLAELASPDPTKGAALPCAVAYREGKALLAEGKTAEARARLIQARDLDGLRFRAPSAFNQRIRELATRRKLPLADVEQAFFDQAVQGVPGLDLFMEHLHPNPRGYMLLARSFADVLASHGLAGLKGAQPALSDEVYLERSAHTRLDTYLGELKTASLVAEYPFKGRTGFKPGEAGPAVREVAEAHLKHKILWDQAHFQLGDAFLAQGLEDQARREYLAVQVCFPHHPTPWQKLAGLEERRQEWDKAQTLLEHSLTLDPDQPGVAIRLGRIYLERSAFADAVQLLMKVEAQEKRAPTLGLRDQVLLGFYLGTALAQSGDLEGAVTRLEATLQLAPDHGECKSLLAQIRRVQENGR